LTDHTLSSENERNEKMVSKFWRQCWCAGGVSGLPLEAKVVVADPDGRQLIAMRAAADLCIINRLGAVHLFAVLTSPENNQRDQLADAGGQFAARAATNEVFVVL
jgi:hypothetical protein